ncbi:MAG TPA: YhgE/Pip domain-containing protein, partial [Kineosporiaceae bacterium]
MTPLLHLAGVELRRFRRSRISRAALLALVVIPLLYGALYLWAFWNPSAGLSRVPVALVDADRPATVPSATPSTSVDAGHDLEQRLRGGGGFDWHVTDAADAARGLDDGRYHLVVTVPADFSASLVSVAGSDPRPAVLDVRTDDANGYLAGQLARTVLAEIRHAIATGSTTRYVENVYASLAQLHDRLGQAASGAARLATGAASAHSGAGQLADGTAQLAAGAGRLADGADAAAAGAARLSAGAGTLAAGLHALDTGVAALRAKARALADGATQVAAGTDQVAELGTQLTRASAAMDAARAEARSQLLAAITQYARDHPDDARAEMLATDLRARLDTLDTRLDAVSTRLRTASQRTTALAAGAHQVAQGAAALAGTAPALASAVHRAAAGAQTLAGGAAGLASGTGALASGARSLDAGAVRAGQGATALASGLG